MPDLNQLSSQLTSSIASLNSQITFLNTLYQNIIQTPADRTDLLLSYADQLQKYLEQSGGWPGAMDEHEAATNEKNNLLSLQSQIQSALQACQASQIQQQYNYQP
jgi:small-conductance mechanosensitive channel